MYEIDEHEAKTKRQLADHEIQRQTNVSELIAASKNADNRRGGQGGSFIPSQGPGPSDGRGGTRGQSQSEEMDWEGAGGGGGGGGGAAYPSSASRRKPVGPSNSGHASNTRKRNRDK